VRVTTGGSLCGEGERDEPHLQKYILSIGKFWSIRELVLDCPLRCLEVLNSSRSRTRGEERGNQPEDRGTRKQPASMKTDFKVGALGPDKHSKHVHETDG
jgi:hypothetical protein